MFIYWYLTDYFNFLWQTLSLNYNYQHYNMASVQYIYIYIYIYISSIYNYKQLQHHSLAIGHTVSLILGTEIPKAGVF